MSNPLSAMLRCSKQVFDLHSPALASSVHASYILPYTRLQTFVLCCLPHARQRSQQCLSPVAMISPVLSAAKSSNLDADVNVELSEDSRHRGLKGTPLSPQVLILAASLLVKFDSPFACCPVSQCTCVQALMWSCQACQCCCFQQTDS